MRRQRSEAETHGAAPCGLGYRAADEWLLDGPDDIEGALNVKDKRKMDQLFSGTIGVGEPRQATPEELLLLAIVERAVDDLVLRPTLNAHSEKYRRAVIAGAQRIRRDASAYLSGALSADPALPTYNFAGTCAHFGWDADAIRKQLNLMRVLQGGKDEGRQRKGRRTTGVRLMRSQWDWSRNGAVENNRIDRK